MSKAYEKLLKKLDRPVATATMDPQVAALQARFSAIVDSSKRDILGTHSDEEEEDADEDDENLDEDDEMDEDDMFEDENDVSDDEDGESLLKLNVIGEENDNDDENGIDLFAPSTTKKSTKPDTTAKSGGKPKKVDDFGLEGVDEEELDDEDDEYNIFEYEWEVERDESDSELDGNDNDEDDNDTDDKDVDTQDPVAKKGKGNDGNQTGTKAPPSAKSKIKTADTLAAPTDTTTTTTTQSLYDQFFNTTLTPEQIHILEGQSAFAQPQSDHIGLKFRDELSESEMIKKLRYNNKYNPYGRTGISNSMTQGVDDVEIPKRQITLVNNSILRSGTLLDQYNIYTVQHKYPNLDLDEEEADIEYELEKLTSIQIGAQQLQISSDRVSKNLSPLPTLPVSDSKYPVDQSGDGLIVTPGKQRRQIEKSEASGTAKKSGYTKAQLQKLKSQSDQLPKMALKRPVPSFKSLGFKQRLAQHVTESGLVTPTAYDTMRNAYIGYSSDQSQYQFLTNRMMKMENDKTTILSKDHGLLLPSYQHDTQTIFSSLLATYTDTLFALPIPPPNQQIDWFIYRDVYLLHIINHVLTHRDRIIAHNEALYRRDARQKEEGFIMELSRITNKDQRMLKLEQHLDQLHYIMESDSCSPQEQQDAQARLAVLTHSHKTRVHIKRLQDQIEMEKLNQYNKETGQDSSNSKKPSTNDNESFNGKPRKMTAKQQERLQVQQREAADLEFQQQMSNLKLTKAREKLSNRTLSDTTDNQTPTTQQHSTVLSTTDHSDKYRDQGFTRPVVLILTPSKLHAYTVLSRLIELLPPQQTKRIINHDRFHSEYGDSMGEYTLGNNKPLDYNLNFNGCNNDSFYFGVQFNGNGLKLFAPLYQSDIIIASPLGLKLIVGTDGMNQHDRKADFLSSIEISVIDQLQLISHQNMDHLTDVLQVINGFPSKTQNIDFSRIRSSTLNGHARFHRQNIWLTGMLTPQLQFLYQRFCENKNGSIRLRPSEYNSVSTYFKLPPGALKQTFYRIDLNAAISTITKAGNKNSVTETVFDKKLQLWFSDIWPRIKDWYTTEGCTVIFVPSSYDFVRIRNVMEEKFVDYMIMSEYTDQRMIDSAKTRVVQGTAKFLLVSERFWVFNRSSFYGIKHIVWYGIPTMPQAYIDFVNYIKQATGVTGRKLQGTQFQTTQNIQSSTVKNLSTANTSSSLIKNMSTSITATKQPTSFVVYTQQDAMALERIVGSEFARELLLSTENIHVIQ